MGREAVFLATEESHTGVLLLGPSGPCDPTHPGVRLMILTLSAVGPRSTPTQGRVYLATLCFDKWKGAAFTTHPFPAEALGNLDISGLALRSLLLD